MSCLSNIIASHYHCCYQLSCSLSHWLLHIYIYIFWKKNENLSEYMIIIHSWLTWKIWVNQGCNMFAIRVGLFKCRCFLQAQKIPWNLDMRGKISCIPCWKRFSTSCGCYTHMWWKCERWWCPICLPWHRYCLLRNGITVNHFIVFWGDWYMYTYTIISYT